MSVPKRRLDNKCEDGASVDVEEVGDPKCDESDVTFHNNEEAAACSAIVHVDNILETPLKPYSHRKRGRKINYAELNKGIWGQETVVTASPSKSRPSSPSSMTCTSPLIVKALPTQSSTFPKVQLPLKRKRNNINYAQLNEGYI